MTKKTIIQEKSPMANPPPAPTSNAPPDPQTKVLSDMLTDAIRREVSLRIALEDLSLKLLATEKLLAVHEENEEVME